MQTGPHFRRLNDAVVQLLDDFSMVTFTPLDVSDEESIEDLLLQIDMAIQVGTERNGPSHACRHPFVGCTACLSHVCHPAALPQYGEDQDVKTQEMGDYAEPEEGPDY